MTGHDRQVASDGRLTITRTTVTVSVLMFGGPFLLLAACYAALPVEVPVLLNRHRSAILAGINVVI